MSPRPFWPPLLAGIMLGLVLLLTFLLTGHGLGASGFFTRATAAAGGWLAPSATEASAYLSPYLRGNPLDSWISWEIVGVAIGALAGSMVSGRFRLALERGAAIGANERVIYALIGGVLVGFGARLVRGCTSGVGLSGGATLAVAAFVFLIAFFAAGFLVTFAARRVWR